VNQYLFLRRMRGPIILLTFGITAILDEYAGISYAHSWPLYIIVWGLLKLAENAILAQNPPTQPAPWPGNQPGYQSSYQPSYQPGYQPGYPPAVDPAATTYSAAPQGEAPSTSTTLVPPPDNISREEGGR
jgi:hypothetical protein